MDIFVSPHMARKSLDPLKRYTCHMKLLEILDVMSFVCFVFMAAFCCADKFKMTYAELSDH